MRISHSAVAAVAAVFLFTAVPCLIHAGFQYEARGKRDPFVPLVGGSRPVSLKLEDITSAEDVKVEGIAVGASGRRIVILNGEVLKENDKVGEVQVKNIYKTSVTIVIGGKSYDLYLSGEEGGQKSE
jgi:hypothetical protein